MNLINLTPHTITIHAGERVVSVPPSGAVARCAVRVEAAGTAVIGGQPVPLTRQAFGPIEGLPGPQPGVLYIVSALVAQRAGGRADVVSPGEQVRDAEGRVTGCRALTLALWAGAVISREEW